MNDLLAELLSQWQQGRITGGELLSLWRRDGQPDVLLVQILLSLLESQAQRLKALEARPPNSKSA